MNIVNKIFFIILFLMTAFCNLSADNSYLNISQSTIRFPVPTAFDLDNGFIDIDQFSNNELLQLTVPAPLNRQWNLYIYCSQMSFYSQQNQLSLDHLLFKVSFESNSRYRPVNFNKQLLFSGKGTQTIDLNFRLLIDWNIAPDTYDIEVFYELEFINQPE